MRISFSAVTYFIMCLPVSGGVHIQPEASTPLPEVPHGLRDDLHSAVRDHLRRAVRNHLHDSVHHRVRSSV
jgi:hypothetical protein